MSEQVIPGPGEWNLAVEHSLANPEHILGPYTGELGTLHMDCSCGWDSAEAEGGDDG